MVNPIKQLSKDLKKIIIIESGVVTICNNNKTMPQQVQRSKSISYQPFNHVIK